MRLPRLVLKNLARRKGRTLLSIGGVACAMALVVLVDSLGLGMERALDSTDAARTLVVFRESRYCPQTSFLPESYAGRMRAVEGVESVLPVKVFLNNCRASLDLVAFHGAPVDELLSKRSIEVIEGDVERFRREADAALVGREFAARKGLSVGDSFRFGEIDVKVRGVFASDEAAQESLVLTHLEYLQRAGPVDRLGTVTQFEVRVEDAAQAGAIGLEIDALFATAEEPTSTRPAVAHLEGATRDLKEVLRFGRMLGFACVAVVLALVANAVLMSVQERARELAVLRALGFEERHVIGLVLGEALSLAALGGMLGAALVLVVLQTTHLAIGSEGVSISFAASPALFARGFLLALGAGAIAGLAPAIQGARASVAEGLRR